MRKAKGQKRPSKTSRAPRYCSAAGRARPPRGPIYACIPVCLSSKSPARAPSDGCSRPQALATTPTLARSLHARRRPLSLTNREDVMVGFLEAAEDMVGA